MRRYALRDGQWDRISDLLPGKASDVGVTARDNRLFVEAVLYRYHTGIASDGQVHIIGTDGGALRDFMAEVGETMTATIQAAM